MASTIDAPQASKTTTPLPPPDLAKLYLHNESNYPQISAQIEHRTNIVSKWNIKPGDKVLEIGCGQGDCTLVLANAVGESGHVTGLDPARLDYGKQSFSPEARR
jgi:ubiquinone/menaquinone biosynthesis C-methylase UbiE